MKNHITILKKKIKVVVFIMLLCLIALPSLHAQTVSPNVRVNTADYYNVSLDGGAKSIAVFNNTIYVIWLGQPTETTGNIYFAKSIDGGASFSADLNISQGVNLVLHDFPSLAVSQNGTIHIAWAATNDEESYDIWYIKSSNGGDTFDTPIEITTNNFSLYPSIAAYNNNVYIFYANAANYPLVDYYFTRSTNNGNTFDTPIQINDAPCIGNIEFDGATSIALNAEGNIYLTWVDGRRLNGKGDICFAKSTDGGLNFSPNVIVNDINQPGADYEQYIPSITVDASNNVYISFSDKRLGDDWGNNRAYISKSNDGGNSFSTEVFLAGYSETCKHHDIITNSTGKLYAAICANIPPNWGVWLYESADGGNNFSSALALSGSFNNSFSDIRIVSDTDGEVYAIWQDDREGFNNIYFTKANFEVSILESNFSDKYFLYPNPTNGSFNLETSQKEMNLKISVSDLQGRILYEKSNNNSSTVNIDIAMPQGIYFVTIESENEIKTLKLIKN